MKKYVSFLATAAIITIVFGTIYGTAQQLLRLNANDPQIQIATDFAARLNKGTDPKKLFSDKVDMQNSLEVFVIVYDKQGSVVTSTGYLDKKAPVVPIGVLRHTPQWPAHHTVTWQPKKGVRIASAEVAAKNYYVLSGRSLRETEAREDSLLKIAFCGWAASLLVLTTAYCLKKK